MPQGGRGRSGVLLLLRLAPRGATPTSHMFKIPLSLIGRRQAGTLRQSVNAEADMKTLMAAQVLFWLLRAPDGHAKNFSIQLLPRGRFQLTPLYDVMSVYPVLDKGRSPWSPYEIKLAMALIGKSRHYEMQGVQRRHFNSTAQKVNYASTAEPIIEELLARTLSAIAEVQAE